MIQRYLITKLPLVAVIVIVVTLIAYYFFPYKSETGTKGIYGIATFFRWIPYFGMMLMGTWIGMKQKQERNIRVRWTDVVLLFFCGAIFYGIQFVAKKIPFFGVWQILTLPFLVGIVYYFWKCCNADCFRKIYNKKIGRWIIMFVGGLCLESYLIQLSLFTDKLNWLFPLNIPLIMLVILAVSYICRCLARFISQTFRTEDYDWKKVFSA